MRKQSDNPDVGHSAGQLDCLFKSQRAGEGARRGGRLFKGRKKTQRVNGLDSNSKGNDYNTFGTTKKF